MSVNVGLYNYSLQRFSAGIVGNVAHWLARRFMIMRFVVHVVVSLDKILHDNYLCLAVFNEQ